MRIFRRIEGERHESNDEEVPPAAQDTERAPHTAESSDDIAMTGSPDQDDQKPHIKAEDSLQEIIEISDDETGSEHPTSTRGGSVAHQSDRDTARANLERMIELKKRRVQLEKQEIDYELELLALRQGR